MPTFVSNRGEELNAEVMEEDIVLLSDERQEQSAEYAGAEGAVNEDGYLEFGPYTRLNVHGRNKNTQVLAFQGEGGAIGEGDTVHADGSVERAAG